MDSFRDILAADLRNVFLQPGELAELRTVRYDGKTYENIPVSLQDSGLRQRQRLSASGTGRNGIDNAQGLFTAHSVLFCALEDLGGKLPKQGNLLEIGQENGFFRPYLIASATHELGMLKLELEANRQ